ncbi:bifunctional PIG-L family deacetylase/class I SAM-dependent methyltransferase [Cryobacterium sp. SO2]|uniref:bifunctional PIG-L family deacetylase/class I SAM-dependent methyltransferase n=1 Tax=Cryobacterium sp. SO2 TaxID=1897060 RepID=UPI00223CF78B|nr:bifunctional PIG-L family deacetylase/class I SAM-dependent methyltransferase [Cryobacterium sp. SO2]WEO77753.1 bifunctional PIG-L family deacetylase/class I SAM-dependent methyltransferase [Cryobacterium sp. SO2]
MVTFTHNGDGTSEEVWQGADWAARARPLTLSGCDRLVVVAAHPDDESLGAGGLIVAAAAQGIPVTVIVASNGEASHPHSTTTTPAGLAAVRRTEVVAAVRALTPAARIRLLDLPDGRLAAHRTELADALRAEARADEPERATGVWLVAPWRSDGHPDHTAAGEAAALVAGLTGARLLEYPIWAWHWSTPADAVWPVGDGAEALYSIALGAAGHARKSAAMAAHVSQVRPLSALPGDEAIVQPGFAAHFERSWEMFLGAAPSITRAPDAAAPGRAAPDDAAPDDAAADSLTAEFFDEFYAGSHDPWGFETRWYESRKRAVTLAALPLARYTAALELGCSIGVLSRELVDRCDTLLATDIAEQPLEVARRRLAGLPGVTVERRTLPAEWPDGSFDLVVLSEIGYYCSPADLGLLLERCRQSLRPGGSLVACHWRHPVGEYPLGGDDVHAALAALPGLERTVQHLERDFVLEVYEPAPARSVAEREGLLP